MPLTDVERERYFRQLGLSGWDQEKLRDARVLVAGVGGLGCASSLYLALAGVGTIRLVDEDRVEPSDLNRQFLYTEASLGRLKVDEARKALRAHNPHIQIEAVADKVDEDTVEALAKGCQLIVDGMDNIEARFVLNRFSVRREVPYLFGAVQGWQGMATLLRPPRTGCLACLLPSARPSPRPVPVAGFVPGLIGLVQSSEAVRSLMGLEGSLQGRLLVYDGLSQSFDIVEWNRSPHCPVCGRG